MPAYLEIALISFSMVIVLLYASSVFGYSRKQMLPETVIIISILLPLFYYRQNNTQGGSEFFSAIIVCMLLYALLGFLDDRIKMSFLSKVLFQAAIASIAAAFGIKVHFVSNIFSGGYYYFYFLAIPLTIAWFVVIINAFLFSNILKNFAMSVCFLLSGICFTASVQKSTDYFSLTAAAVLCGVSLAYFISERILKIPSPGNAALMPLGFLLAFVSIIGVSKRIAFVTLLFPVVIIGIPMMSVGAIIIFSYLKGIAVNGSEHKVKDRLNWIFSRKRILIYIYLTIFYLSSIVVFLTHDLSAAFKVLAVFAVTVIFMYLGRLLFMVRKEVNYAEIQKRVNILGVAVDNCTRAEAASFIDRAVRNNEKVFIVTPNTMMIEESFYDKKLKEILDRSHLNIPDGIGLVWAADFLGTPISERVPGVDIVRDYLKMKKEKKARIYLFGGEEGVAKKASEKILEFSDNIEIAGYRSGFFSDDRDIIEEINRLDVHFLIVGMGVPRQEKWIYDNFSRLKINVAAGVGGTIDVFAGTVKRAPVFFQRFGLEWLYRIICQPWRLVKALSIPRFVFQIFREKLKE